MAAALRNNPGSRGWCRHPFTVAATLAVAEVLLGNAARRISGNGVAEQHSRGLLVANGSVHQRGAETHSARRGCEGGDSAARSWADHVRRHGARVGHGMAKGPRDGAWHGAADVGAAIVEGARRALGADGLACAVFDEPTRKLSLNLDRAVHGEIATQSFVPLKWLLEPHATLRAVEAGGALRLDLEGIYLLPFEGLQLYADSGVSTPDTSYRAVRNESRDVYEYFESNTLKSGFPYYAARDYFSPGFLADPRHKLARVWHAMSKQTVISMLLGSKKKALILYFMLLLKPLKVVSFVFADYEDKGVHVGIKTELDRGAHGATVDGEPADKYFKRNRLEAKWRRLMRPSSYIKYMDQFKSRAGSVRSLLAGVLAEDAGFTKKNGGVPVPGCRISSLLKLLSVCSGAQRDMGTPYQAADKTWGCQGGSHGRVVWDAPEAGTSPTINT